MSTSFLRQPWVRWAVRLVGAALILYLGLTVRQQRTHQQQTRAFMASALQSSVHLAANYIAVAHIRLKEGYGDAAVAFLAQSQTTLNTATIYLPTYTLLAHADSSTLDGTLDHYGFAINMLISRLSAAPAGTEESFLPEVRALRADLDLWRATFSEDLLATGTPTQLDEGVRVFCKDLQVAEVREYACAGIP